MTDTDIDIDPAFAAHLQRTLRTVAATVEPARDAELGNVVRLVTTPPPADRRRHAWSWLGAAAVTGLVAGAGLMAVADRDPENAQVPVASTVAPGPDLAVLASVCERALGEMSTPVPDDWPAQPTPPELDSATLLLFDTEANPPHQILAVVGSTTGYTCEVNDNNAPAVTSDGNTFEIEFAAGPGPGEVQVVSQSWYNENNQNVGPGWVYVIGRSGPEVTDVDVELPDGTVIAGEVQRGWFVVEGLVPSDVPIFEERLNWTIASGDRHSSRVDLLDPPDEAEVCAAAADCVNETLIYLRSQAENLGDPEQAQALADLDVTTDERVAARQRFADCVNASPYDITVTVLGGDGMSVGGADMDAESPNWDAQNNVQILCGAAHSDLVDEAWNLLDAQRRVAEG